MKRERPRRGSRNASRADEGPSVPIRGSEELSLVHGAFDDLPNAVRIKGMVNLRSCRMSTALEIIRCAYCGSWTAENPEVYMLAGPTSEDDKTSVVVVRLFEGPGLCSVADVASDTVEVSSDRSYVDGSELSSSEGLPSVEIDRTMLNGSVVAIAPSTDVSCCATNRKLSSSMLSSFVAVLSRCVG